MIVLSKGRRMSLRKFFSIAVLMRSVRPIPSRKGNRAVLMQTELTTAGMIQMQI